MGAVRIHLQFVEWCNKTAILRCANRGYLEMLMSRSGTVIGIIVHERLTKLEGAQHDKSLAHQCSDSELQANLD